jgi:hypothetical protein
MGSGSALHSVGCGAWLRDGEIVVSISEEKAKKPRRLGTSWYIHWGHLEC